MRLTCEGNSAVNGKIVAAFIAGALIASGIVYLAVRPQPQTATIADVRPASVMPPAPARAPAAEPEPQTPTPTPKPEAKASPAPKAAPQHEHGHLSRTPIREKPSPMPPPVHHEKPPMVARNEPQVETPPSTPAPAPEPAPPAPESAPPPVPPAPEPAPAPPVIAKTAPEPEVRVPHSVVLTAGTPLVVRVGENVSAARNQVGDSFFATLEQQLVIDGFIIADRGSRVIGKVAEAVPAGRGGGESHLRVELVRLSTSDGQRVPIRTEQYAKDGSASAGSDLAKIGAGAAIGAAIGAMAGGGKGAAIGAGAGAAAGTGAVLLSSGRSVEIPVETRLTFRVKDSITLTEKLD